METKQELLTLNGKEYLLDIEQAEQLGLLKEKDSRVKNWEEFKEKYRYKTSYYAGPDNVVNTICDPGIIQCARQLTSHEAKAIAAFSQLLKLRRDWVEEWEPDWEDESKKYVLRIWRNHICFEVERNNSAALSFPTEKMAKDFLETFRELITEAKILI